MLLSPVISIMSVFRLPTGENVSPGYVANFKQDVAVFIREIPLTASQLLCLVIKRRSVDNTYAEVKVCRKRVEDVGLFSFSTIQALFHIASILARPNVISCLKMDCCQIYQRWTPTTKTQLSLMKEP
jgi:hypothetical protein